MTALISSFSGEVWTERSLARAFIQGVWLTDLFEWNVPYYTAEYIVSNLHAAGFVEKISFSWMLGAAACEEFVERYVIPKISSLEIIDDQAVINSAL